MNIDYNKNFLYNYNIFNKNNVGIGTSTPKHTLDITGNLNLIGNLNIGDNIYLNNIINKDLNVLHYNQLTNEVKPVEIDNTQNNLYNWNTVNNQLDFNYLNNIDNVIYNYISSEYYLDNTINLYIHTPIIITHLFIYKKNIQGSILDTDLGDLNNFSMNTISNNSTSIQKLNKYYYKLNNSIEIYSLQNINFTSYPSDSYIKLVGYYKFNQGNTWNSIHENDSNIFVNRNININGINTNNNQLFVNGNTNVNYDLNINKSITGNICSVSNNLNITNKISLSSITSTINNLNINLKKNKLSIGTNNNDAFCNIGNNTEIDYIGNVKSKDYNLINTLNLNNTNNFIKYNNNNLISFLENQTILNSFIFNKNDSSNSSINDIYLLIKNNINISTNNKKYLYVDGNIKITGNIDVKKNINIITTASSLGSDINKTSHDINIYTNNLNVTNKFNAYNINNTLTKTNILCIPKYSNYIENIKPGLIYYNTSTDKYSGFDNNNTHLTFINKLDLNQNQNNNLDSNNISVFSKFRIPIKYNNNITTHNDFGIMQYNLNSLKCEIYNGYKYGSVEYENNICELQGVYASNLNALKPAFHNRIEKYTYEDSLEYINIITNPNNQILIQEKIIDTLNKETIYQNNSLENTIINYNINTFCNNLIITNNRNDINMSYSINSLNTSILNKKYPITNVNIIDNIYNLNNDGSYSLINNDININLNFTIDEYNNIIGYVN